MQKNQVSTSAHLFYSYYLKCLFLILKCYFLSARLSGCLIFCPIVIVTVFLFLCVVLSLFVDKSTVKGCPCFFLHRDPVRLLLKANSYFILQYAPVPRSCLTSVSLLDVVDGLDEGAVGVRHQGAELCHHRQVAK